MEIIKRGQRPEDETWDITCKNCQSELRYKRSDTHVDGDWAGETSQDLHYDDWTSHTTHYKNAYRYIYCPVCKEKIVIEKIGNYSEKRTV